MKQYEKQILIECKIRTEIFANKSIVDKDTNKKYREQLMEVIVKKGQIYTLIYAVNIVGAGLQSSGEYAWVETFLVHFNSSSIIKELHLLK